MTEKERRTVTISKENDEWLGENGRNASQVVDELVTKRRESGGLDAAIAQFRIEQVKSEIESMEKQLEMKRDELAEIKEDQRKAERRESVRESERWDETLSALDFTHLQSTGTYISASDGVVADRAAEHDMTVEEFRAEAIERYEERHR